MSFRPLRNRQSSSGSLDGSNFVKSRQRSRASSDGSHSDVSLSEPTIVPPSVSGSQSAGSREVAAPESSISENPAAEEGGLTLNRQKAEEGDGTDEFKDAIDSRIPTFFSAMSTR